MNNRWCEANRRYKSEAFLSVSCSYCHMSFKRVQSSKFRPWLHCIQDNPIICSAACRNIHPRVCLPTVPTKWWFFPYTRCFTLMPNIRDELLYLWKTDRLASMSKPTAKKKKMFLEWMAYVDGSVPGKLYCFWRRFLQLGMTRERSELTL